MGVEQQGYNKTTLANGVRVITENFPSSRAVTVGFWALSGTRDETSYVDGVSHFLEHIVFKGTKNYSAYQIALSLESVGGEINAYTTKEYTCFHTLSLKENLSLSFDVLAELVTKPKFPLSEFELEKNVILQELNMSKEEYDEYIYDYYLEKSAGKNSAGKPILGTNKSISGIKLSDVKKYHKSEYTGNNLIVTAVGSVDHEKFVDEVKKKIGRLKSGEPSKPIRKKYKKPKFKAINEVLYKDTEQVHMLMGFPTVSYKDKIYYESFFVAQLLGGGMTSKLYQNLREKKGLVYTVYSYLYTFLDSAMSFIYAGSEYKNYQKVLIEMKSELLSLKKNGVKKSDIKLYKKQIKGSFLLSADDIDSRMTALAHNEMLFGRHIPLTTHLEKIEAISFESVNEYINKYLLEDKIGLTVIGPLKDQKDKDWISNFL